jgi:hypothetical protein
MRRFTGRSGTLSFSFSNYFKAFTVHIRSTDWGVFKGCGRV